jgi:hypothetical protein
MQNGEGGEYEILLSSNSFPYFTKSYKIELTNIPSLKNPLDYEQDISSVIECKNAGEKIDKEFELKLDIKNSTSLKNLSDVLVLINFKLVKNVT